MELTESGLYPITGTTAADMGTDSISAVKRQAPMAKALRRLFGDFDYLVELQQNGAGGTTYLRPLGTCSTPVSLVYNRHGSKREPGDYEELQLSRGAIGYVTSGQGLGEKLRGYRYGWVCIRDGEVMLRPVRTVSPAEVLHELERQCIPAVFFPRDGNHKDALHVARFADWAVAVANAIRDSPSRHMYEAISPHLGKSLALFLKGSAHCPCVSKKFAGDVHFSASWCWAESVPAGMSSLQKKVSDFCGSLQETAQQAETVNKQAAEAQHQTGEETMSQAIIKIVTESTILINGRPADQLSDDECFNLIAQAEAEVRRLSAVEAKPLALVARISELKAGIKALVAHMDKALKDKNPEAFEALIVEKSAGAVWPAATTAPRARKRAA